VWVFRVFTYGLETGIYLVLLAATVLMTLRGDRPIAAGRFGVLGGLTGLARIDYGLIFAIQILFLLRQRRLRLTGAIGAGVIALMVTLPWFLWVHGQTGSWMPRLVALNQDGSMPSTRTKGFGEWRRRWSGT
jgi:hypothetical protein